MIIEFKVANYRSISAERTLSFVADRATRHPNSLIKRPGYRLLKAIGLFGANASGKSNIVKALGAMSAFVRDSATKMNDGDPILAAEPYRLDPETRNAPSRFEITFVTDGTIYTYGFAADAKRVYEEWLQAKAETSNKKLMSVKRMSGTHGAGGTWERSGMAEADTTLLVRRTRDNALFLSTAARENVKGLLPAYRFIRDYAHTYDMSVPQNSLITYAARYCKNDGQLRQQVIALLRDADTGIESLEVDKTLFADILAVSVNDWPGQTAPVMAENRYDSLSFALPMTTTRRDKNGSSVDFDFKEDESHGTNRFFAVAVLLLDTLKKRHISCHR